MTTVTKTCECGQPVEVPIPDGLVGVWRDMLVRWEVRCVKCEREAEARRVAYESDLAARERERELRARAKRSGIPAGLRELEWRSVDGRGRRDAVLAARRWADGRLPGLMLNGPIGVGKTYLAAVAAWACLQHRPVRWASVPSLMAALGAGWSDERRKAALALVDGTDALVLDDLDKTRPSEYAAEQLFGAVDARVTAGAPLLVTTNLLPDDLVEKFPDPFGQSIASRLAGYCETYGLAGVDRRVRKLAAA